jgi:hypothetical protein
MLRPAALTLAILAFVAAVGPARAATSATLVTVSTPRGAKQAFILIKPAKPPVASVILFAGGHGALGLQSATSMRWGAGNFLVRSRDKFAAHDLMVAVIDAPADQQKGMNAVFRMSGQHAADIGAVAAHLKKEADAPVWLVGTSMGTFSAAGGAIGSKGVDGLVLTSTITRAKPHWKIAQSHRDGVASMALARVAVPVLILSHRKDGCDITPGQAPAGADRRQEGRGGAARRRCAAPVRPVRGEIAARVSGDRGRGGRCHRPLREGQWGVSGCGNCRMRRHER